MKKLLVLFLPALLLTGCSLLPRPRAAERLLPVQTLGWDGQPGRAAVSLSAPGVGADEGPMLLTGRGESLYAALQDAQRAAPREELFFAHVRFAAVGEDAARESVQPVLDYFERSPQTRLDLPLLIVRGGEASALVTGGEDPAFEITEVLASLQREGELTGEFPFFTVLDTARSLAGSGLALCCALESADPAGEVLSAEEGATSARAVGLAVLRDGRLRGFLSPEASRGAALLLGRGKGMTLTLREGGRTATVRVRTCRVRFRPAADGAPARAELRCGAALTGCDGPGEPELSALERSAEEALAAMAEAALTECLALDAPLPLLAGAKDAGTCRAEAVCRIRRSYDLNAPVPVDGEEP